MQIPRAGETLSFKEDDEYREWIFNRLNLPDHISPRSLKPIDLTYFAQYDPASGFKVSIDAVVNLDSIKIGKQTFGKDLTFAIFSLSPPAAYYSHKLTDEVSFKHLINLKSC